MESRNVALTLEKAREFYNSGNTALREVALQAYTEEELTTPKFTDIMTFGDAVKALGLYNSDVQKDLEKFDNYKFEGNASKHLKAIYKLDIIRKALNGNWKPSFVKDIVYYPFVRFYPANKAKDVANSNRGKLGPSFIADGEKYTLVGGGSSYYSCGVGVGGFCMGVGHVNAYAGLLCCKSEEIAHHLSRYFMKEIFEAVCAQHIGMYEWVDKV